MARWLCGWLLVSAGWAVAAPGPDARAPGAMETIQVTAPRVKIADVIAAIGRRMEYEKAQQEEYAFTSLTTVVVRQGAGGYTLEETASRYHHDRKSGDREVQLWERVRKYQDGELVSDEVDEKLSADYVAAQDQVIAATPFSPGGADRYTYRVLAREVVGNSLVYKIGFAPRNRFDALPSGTIWVDYSNWVVRRMEASLTGAVPYPLLLKSVPVYRLSQERFGDSWFPTEMYLRLELRHLPLVSIPESVEVRVRLQDVVINGMPLEPSEAVPRPDGPGVDVAGTGSGFWLSEVASADSLSEYWHDIGRDWQTDVTAELGPVTLPAARLDSLSALGGERLAELAAHGGWRTGFSWLSVPGFNRVQGAVPRVAAQITQKRPLGARVAVTAGYGFANQRPVVSGDGVWPLVRARWSLPPLTPGEPKLPGAEYQRLALRLNGGQRIFAFAGDGGRKLRSASAFLYGSDPNHYGLERLWSAELRWRVSRALVVAGGGGWREQQSQSVHRTWNVWGRELHPAYNRTADRVDDRFVRTGAQWRRGGLRLEGQLKLHNVNGRRLRELQLKGRISAWDRFGDRWILRGFHRRFDGSGPVPVQWRSWLGDYGSLRGYGAGELSGDAGAQVALDVRLGFDVWRAVHMPVLQHWGLQPLGFVDWGQTWNRGGGAADWRADVGFGLGKRFDLPGLGRDKNLRVYMAHPVLEGSEGRGWRVLLAVEK